MMNSEKMIASLLMDIEAVKLSPDKPFTWASGWKSPIYCDNRKTLSYPLVRNAIAEEFAKKIRSQYPDTDVIAGVATGAIAHGLLVAQALELPFIYVRSAAKQHGLGNQVEGAWKHGQKVVVIEDLVSTGGSSLAAVEALRAEELEVLGMMAIFTYGFPAATENFAKAQVKLTTLSDYHALINLAYDANYISLGQKQILQEWRKSPATWDPSQND
jgi:orotate phosphoribosyltransferase